MTRYLLSSDTLEFSARMKGVDKTCMWCGKPVRRKNQFFCSAVIVNDYYSSRVCYNEFFKYWVRIPRFKRVIFLRDDFTCQKCGYHEDWINEHGIKFPVVSELECDHIHPYSKGGKTELSNLQTLCRPCNRTKSAKDESINSKQQYSQEVMELNI